MSDVRQIRAGLLKAAKERAQASKKQARATQDLRRWLREAQSAEGLSMSEAAELGGVSRKTAYLLLRED